jgi:hypothetical protein
VGNRVEPASSSRSKCVVCNAPIGKGEARLAEEYADIGIPKLIMRFYHLVCAAAAQPELLHHALRDVRPGTIFDRADIEARVAPAIERAKQHRIASYEAKRAVAVAVAPHVADDATTLAVLAELEADPENAELLAIAADQLMAQRDPRGELITVQLALAKASRRLPLRDRSSDPEDADDEADLEARDAAEMTNQLAQRFEELSTQLAVGPLDRGDRAVWGVGFVRRLELLNKSATRLAELAPLWTHPSMRIVAELKLSFSVVGDAAAMIELARVVRPTLRKLELGHWSDAVLDHLQPLLDALPRLRALELTGKLRSRIAHPAVESIKLAPYTYRGELANALIAITGEGLPALRELAFEGRAPRESYRNPDREPVEIEGDDIDAIVQQLAAQGVLATLERLTMAGGKLTERGAAALAGALGERKLARLDLSRLPTARALRPRLAALCDELAFTDSTPKVDGDEWVEHANQPSWGRGKIVRRFEGKLEIAFPKAGNKIFKADAAFLRFG